jgi:peptide deformylase
MQSFPGCVGLAAPQIGEALRVAVVDVSAHPRADSSNGLLVLVNPRIEDAEGSEIGRESCLSLPDVTANVRRATRIRVKGYDLRADCAGLEARCVQHEIDHLYGLLYTDRMGSIAGSMVLRKMYRK